jgi:Rab GDP dissociation inhibitor
VNRKNDIYVACVSSAHHVCAAGYYIAIVSTIIETDDPFREVQPALALFTKCIVETFTHISNQFEPAEDGRSSRLFITRSLDASSHFESVCDDVKSVYERVTGKPLVLRQRKTAEEEQAEAERLHQSAN